MDLRELVKWFGKFNSTSQYTVHYHNGQLDIIVSVDKLHDVMRRFGVADIRYDRITHHEKRANMHVIKNISPIRKYLLKDDGIYSANGNVRFLRIDGKVNTRYEHVLYSYVLMPIKCNLDTVYKEYAAGFRGLLEFPRVSDCVSESLKPSSIPLEEFISDAYGYVNHSVVTLTIVSSRVLEPHDISKVVAKFPDVEPRTMKRVPGHNIYYSATEG